MYRTGKGCELNRLRDYCHALSASKGFWDDPSKFNFGEKIALIHSELSEALEGDRDGKYTDLNHIREWQTHHQISTGVDANEYFAANIKNNVEDELADAVIRIMDLCGHLKIDIAKHIYAKTEYNKSRPYKHNRAY